MTLEIPVMVVSLTTGVITMATIPVVVIVTLTTGTMATIPVVVVVTLTTGIVTMATTPTVTQNVSDPFPFQYCISLRRTELERTLPFAEEKSLL